MLESFQEMCGIQNFRVVLYDFLSRSPDRSRLLLPILSQFEKPTLESERQQRYQTAVLEIISGLCNPSFWTAEQPNVESFAKDFVGFAMFSESKEEEPDDPFKERKEETEKVDDADSDVVIIEDDSNKDKETAEKSEVEEESDNKTETKSSLEMVIASFLHLVNNPEQKLSLVREALVKLMDATTRVGDGGGVFSNVLRSSMADVGLLPLFKRLEASLDGDETLACLSATANILDKVVGDRKDVLHKILEFSPSDHPLTSIISHLTKIERIDEKTKFLMQTLDRFFQMLNDGSVSHKAKKASKPSPIPQVYSKTMDEVYKIYSRPLLQVVEGTQKIREQMRAASRILVHRKITTGTRMGSEVSKLIEANKGKEKAVRKIIRSQMNLPDDDIPVSPSPHKKRRSSSQN
ncbi:hypothetical protein OESDEN_13875 [Oesophagostomum dentatum]|uniref:Uncharacterized protein n=1 Tax=Oesophagostomum dentatum TaxID=61180 RepID=A0A0B1SN55_OESDE|nr:hypothetical protein OESDEN_13875 [Oesophagostomum dentatum]